MNYQILLLGGVGIVVAGASLVLLKQAQEANGFPGPDPDDPDNPDNEPDAQPVDNASAPPPIGDSKWGKVPADFQKLITRTQAVSKIPYLWVYGSICAHRESGFVPTAHNNDAAEVKGSTDGVEAGLARGNPKPKYPSEVKAFGSGGLFGALASSFAWIGLDVAYMPFLRRSPSVVFEPEASAIFLAHYFYRITDSKYANGRTLNMFDVRVGWASPSILKESPNGAKAEAVKGRMREDIQELGWDEKWVASLPVIRKPYSGIKAVAESFGYKPTQED